MRTKDGEVQVSVRLPYWAYRGLRDVAKRHYRSANSQLVALLVEYLATNGVTEPAESTVDPFVVES